VEAHEKIYRSKKRIIFDNFLAGIAWGVGSVIGATIFIAILAYFLSKINFVPVVGDFVTEVNQFVEHKEGQNLFLQDSSNK
jgi:hypothetical protein